METVSLRRINEWDAPAICKLYAPYVEGGTVLDESEMPTLSETIQRIDRYTYGMGWLMCEVDRVPLGFCYAKESRVDPENIFQVEIEIYVKPGCYRRQIGTSLFRLMEDILSWGNRRTLIARVGKANADAIAFFCSLGFKESLGSTEEITVLKKGLTPLEAEADSITKPYLVESKDYEAAREKYAMCILP